MLLINLLNRLLSTIINAIIKRYICYSSCPQGLYYLRETAMVVKKKKSNIINTIVKICYVYQTKSMKETIDNYASGNREDFVEMMELLLSCERRGNRSQAEGQTSEAEPCLRYKGVIKSTQLQIPIKKPQLLRGGL